MGKKWFSPTSALLLSRTLSRFVSDARKNQTLHVFLHCLGLSCLGGALFLQSTVFGGIIQRGYFMGMEQNFAVLLLELSLAGIGALYFVYLLLHFVLSFR